MSQRKNQGIPTQKPHEKAILVGLITPAQPEE